MLTVSGQWNEDLVRDTFCDFDAEAILQTQVNGRGEDFWAWVAEKNGLYSVKSAYRLMCTNRDHNDEAGSSSNQNWKLI
jgi:hypothetical protein